MAKEYKDKPADFCIPNCPNMALTVERSLKYDDVADGLVEGVTIIRCAHEEACSAWNAQVNLLTVQLNPKSYYWICPSCGCDNDAGEHPCKNCGNETFSIHDMWPYIGKDKEN